MIRKKLKLASLKKTNSSENVIESNNEQIALTSEANITSPFFQLPLWQRLYDIECRLSVQLKEFNFLSANVAAVYNPIEYAADLHCAYLKKYLNGVKSVLFIGMNPGPWGMVQTGIPFGYIPAVRDWLKLSGTVNKPDQELAIRPVTGLQCDKLEQSGQRFWGLLQELCGEPENFFQNCFIHNFCPLAFFHTSGRNITPAELKPEKKKPLQNICSQYLRESIELISPVIIISIGRYTEDRVNELYRANHIKNTIVHKCMPHPSPRSLNNTNWNEKAKNWLIDNDIIRYIKTTQ